MWTKKDLTAEVEAVEIIEADQVKDGEEINTQLNRARKFWPGIIQNCTESG